ncbi:MAG TPA: CDP-diacylglycerol--glycerol-3-phosphate 3-phosphatidyltransferase [Thermoanaerobaculia bacterium]|nr:CDP-diacylglycerol--glycerol-3-phosphate 3-phosphatidyltransferase [Thermoanaerobaculia bacterium]
MFVNVPNALTLLRIFLVPLLVVLLLTKLPAREYLALFVFLLAALTDWADGYLARRFKKVTTVGMLLDPIADKLLVSAALISLVDLQEADAWAVCIIIGREFAVSGLRSIASTHGITIAASKLGKWKMATQIVGISLMILGAKLDDIGLWRSTGRAALWVMTVMALISGFEYFRKFLRPLLAMEREPGGGAP